MKKLLASLLGGTLLATSSMAADVKIGFVTTLTTPAAVIGKDMENAVNLAMEHLGGKAGSHNLEVVFGDDGFAPDTGKQVTDRLVKQDNVDIVAGYIWSHVLLASRKSVLDAGKIRFLQTLVHPRWLASFAMRIFSQPLGKTTKRPWPWVRF